MTQNIKKLYVLPDRRKEIKAHTLDIFQTCSIDGLPIDINKIERYFDNLCILDSDTAYQLNLIKEPHNDFDGCLLIRKGFYFIIYNTNHVYGRQRWTVGHELGHIIENHSHINEDVEEAEANYFAKQLFAPMAVISDMGALSRKQIADICQLSDTAARYRVKDVPRHETHKSKYGLTKDDIAFLRQFGRMNQRKKFSCLFG